MRGRLTKKQRQAIMKGLCLTLGVLIVLGAFALIPFIASALPQGLSDIIALPSPETPKEKSSVPEIALSGGEALALHGVEFEEEEPIPVPVAGDDDLPVFSRNLCWYEGDGAALHIINRTNFKIKLSDYLDRDFPVVGKISTEPLVLIVHTHGSESYLESGYDFYEPDETFRSTDEENTVVHIGSVLASRLNALGIPTIHDKTMYDTTDFNKSYVFSREGIIEAIEEYPSVRYVIDLHRDSVFTSEGENVKPLTVINGKKTAQLMIVVGTDEGGAQHPDWRGNLTLATYLQQKMNELYPTLARPINLRSAAFNQALTKGSLLLECGSCGNTIDEAENAAKLFAEAYAEVLKENMGG